MNLKAKLSAYFICRWQVYNTVSDRAFLGDTAILGGTTATTLWLAFHSSSSFSPAPRARWGVCTRLRTHTPTWVLARPLAVFMSRAGIRFSWPSLLSLQRWESPFSSGVFLFLLFLLAAALHSISLVSEIKLWLTPGWNKCMMYCFSLLSPLTDPSPQKNKCSRRSLTRYLDEERIIENKWASLPRGPRATVLMLICHLIMGLILEIW